jgi:hypothetical protein
MPLFCFNEIHGPHIEIDIALQRLSGFEYAVQFDTNCCGIVLIGFDHATA